MKKAHKSRLLFSRFAQTGDTIVEVMLGLSVLAIVLAAAYATTTRSFQSGLDAKYRQEGLTYAEAQLEMIKNADNTSPSTVGSYKVNHPFCIDPASGQIQSVNSQTKTCSLPVGQTNPSLQLPYSIVDNYDSTTQTFVSTVQWQGHSGQANQSILYYKPHDSFVTTTGGSCPTCTSQTQTTPPSVGISFTAVPTSISFKATTQLIWTTTNANSCSASSSPSSTWTGSKPTSSPPGGETSPPLPNTTTFTLDCTNGGSTSQAQVTVDVAQPPKPTAIISANPTTVSYGATTTLTWSSSNAASCTANSSPAGLWSTGGKTAGTATSSALSADSTFSVTCASSITGTQTTSNTATVTVIPLQPPTVWFDPNLYYPNITGWVTPHGLLSDCYFYDSSAYYEWQTQYHHSCLSQVSTSPSAFNTAQRVSTTGSNVPTNPWGYNYWSLCAVNSGGKSCTLTVVR